MTFEVTPLIKNQEYHLNTTPDLPTIWPLLIVVSADEVKALQVSVTIDFSEAKSPMTFEMRI
jgi:hypothetical protein